MGWAFISLQLSKGCLARLGHYGLGETAPPLVRHIVLCLFICGCIVDGGIRSGSADRWEKSGWSVTGSGGTVRGNRNEGKMSWQYGMLR